MEKTNVVEGNIETGNFTIEGNSFLAGKKKFVIRKRKQPKGKPELYLIQLEPFKYISSLFPVPGTSGEFNFDYERQLYKLQKTDNQVSIFTI